MINVMMCEEIIMMTVIVDSCVNRQWTSPSLADPM